MSNEQIKEIVIALINKGNVYYGDSNELIAKSVATIINTLKQEINYR